MLASGLAETHTNLGVERARIMVSASFEALPGSKPNALTPSSKSSRCPAGARYYHGASASHSLDDGATERLRFGACVHHDVQGSIYSSNVVLKGDEPEVRLDTCATSLLQELGGANLRTERFVDRAAHHVEPTGAFGPSLSQQARGFDEQPVTLPTCVGCDQTEGRGIRRWRLEASQVGGFTSQARPDLRGNSPYLRHCRWSGHQRQARWQ